MNRATARENDRERVRDASDIVDIVGEVVNLKPKGREFVGLCPFHDDHSPSMYVVPNKQIFNCFVCGAAGDVFTFVQRYHSASFPEALRMLADRANIELTPTNARAADRDDNARTERERVADANRFARDFFRTILNHPEHGRAAREVIDRRGISPEMVDAFELGAAPDRWDGLLLAAQKRSLPEADLLEAGLVKRRDTGTGSYDALRNRLIFPIHDQTGRRVVAFGGRIIDPDDNPKYLNSPETALFQKNQTLFGLHRAFRAIQKTGKAVVVEGYTDVIACHQAGVTNVVGTLGTALTAGHAKLLRRYGDTIVLLLDADEAGQAAAERGQDRLLDSLVEEIFFATEPLDVRLATIDPSLGAKDPDELLKLPDGRERLQRALDDALHLIDFRVERLRARTADAGPAGKSRAVEAEFNRLAELGLSRLQPVRRTDILAKYAHALGYRVEDLWGMVKVGRRASADAPKPAAAARTGTEPTAAELALGCVLANGKLYRSLSHADQDRLGVDAFADPALRMVADAVHRLGADGEPTDLRHVLDELAAEMAEGADNDRCLAAQQHATRLERLATERAEGAKSTDGVPELLASLVAWLGLSAAASGACGAANDTSDRFIELQRLHGSRKTNPRAKLAGS